MVEQLEIYSFWAAVSFYVLASSLYIFAVIIKKDIAFAYYIGVFAAFLQLISGIARWSITGHPPHFGTYENALTTTWITVVFTLFVIRKYKLHRIFGAILYPLVVIMLAYSLKWDNIYLPLTISERTIWLDIHATFAWLAYGSYTVAFVLGILYLYANSQKKKGLSFETLPVVSSLKIKVSNMNITDELLFKYQLYGFINHTLMMVSGMYYGNILFGRWWQWDPVQSLNLIVWLMFGLAIHVRLFFGWNKEKAAWLMVSFFALFFLSYWVIDFLPWHSTFHKFNITEMGWQHPEQKL